MCVGGRWQSGWAPGEAGGGPEGRTRGACKCGRVCVGMDVVARIGPQQWRTVANVAHEEGTRVSAAQYVGHGLGQGISYGGISKGGISNGGISNGGISNGGISNGGISNGEYPNVAGVRQG